MSGTEKLRNEINLGRNQTTRVELLGRERENYECTGSNYIISQYRVRTLKIPFRWITEDEKHWAWLVLRWVTAYHTTCCRHLKEEWLHEGSQLTTLRFVDT